MAMTRNYANSTYMENVNMETSVATVIKRKSASTIFRDYANLEEDVTIRMKTKNKKE